MSISQNFPTVDPTLRLNFQGARRLDPRVSFTRSSTATYVDEDGLIKTAGVDQARFDYDPATGESLGLLNEEQRTNYEQNTEDPSQWIIVNMVTTGNSVTLPTGVDSTSIEYRGETTDANNKLIRPLPYGAGPTAGETWVFSIFLKAGTEDTTRLQLQNNTGGDSVGRTFNMEMGQWTENLFVQGPNTGDSGYEYYGNGWYRVWLVNTYSATADGQQTFMRLNANSNAVPLTTSFSAWGAQLEKGSFPTSYIPNDASSSTKTRSADNAQITGTNFSSWYNQSEGTFYAKHRTAIGRTTGGAHVYSADVDFQNRISAQYAFDGSQNLNRFISFVRNLGVVYGDFSSDDTALEGIFNKTSHSYSSTITSQSLNGNIVGIEQTLNGLPNPTIFEIGKYMGSFDYLNGHISQLTYYPTRMSNTVLQNLTK